jgi:diguanylate cyclase (GGDEF)-like protein
VIPINIIEKNKLATNTNLGHVTKSTLLLVAFMLTNSIVFSISSTVISILLGELIILIALLFLIKIELNTSLTRNLYFWSNLFTMSILMWITTSPHYILIGPVFILLASLTINTKALFITSAYCIFSLLVLGFIRDNSWMITPSKQAYGYWQIIDGVIILIAAFYTALRVKMNFKHTLKGLNDEILKTSESHSKIEELVNYDSLTGLVNRSYCEQLYSKLFNKVQRNNFQQITVFFLDLDNFKAINDYYDHATGDKVLIEVSYKLKKLIQTGGIACRLSGDEFVLIISRPIHYDANLFASRILQVIATPINIGNNVIDITVSVGIAIAGPKDRQFNDIRKKADLAMYKAKQSGKNYFHLYSDEMYQTSLKQVTIKNDLKTALKNGDFELYLQPKIDLTSKKIESAEALLRWTSNNDTNIGPAEFIPLIESSELICKIGAWVIQQACEMCKDLHNNGFTEMSIAVNISASQLKRGNLEEIVKKALEASKIPAKYLELELTEYAIFSDNEGVSEQLKRLKELGVTLSIDDFGTGYSNLEYLTKFNVDILKIDQSFIKEISHSTDQHAIVSAIIKMAKALGLKVVAEGIETNKQLETLKELDCHYGQGFLWSKPLPSNEFLSYLDKEKLDSTTPKPYQSHQLLRA